MSTAAQRGAQSGGEVCGLRLRCRVGPILADWKGEARSRPIQSPERPLSDRREDMSLSDRERVEGFHLTTASTVLKFRLVSNGNATALY